MPDTAKIILLIWGITKPEDNPSSLDGIPQETSKTGHSIVICNATDGMQGE